MTVCMVCAMLVRPLHPVARRSCSFPILCPVCAAEAPNHTCPECIIRRSAFGAGAAPQEWMCSLDGAISSNASALLTHQQLLQYDARSLQAAVNCGKGLVACTQPDCHGVAVLPNGPEGSVGGKPARQDAAGRSYRQLGAFCWVGAGREMLLAFMPNGQP